MFEILIRERASCTSESDCRQPSPYGQLNTFVDNKYEDSAEFWHRTRSMQPPQRLGCDTHPTHLRITESEPLFFEMFSVHPDLLDATGLS